MRRVAIAALVLTSGACTAVLTYEPFESAPPNDALACGDVPTFADELEPTRELFVDPAGDDGGEGSATAPFATLGHAIDVATPGTAIRLSAGTHDGAFREDVHGSADAPIWIGSVDPQRRAVVEGGEVGLHLRRASYVVIHDLEIRAANNGGVQIDDGIAVDERETSHHVVVRDLSVHDLTAEGDGCVVLIGVDDFVVAHNELEKCGATGFSNGVVAWGSHDGVIARNSVRDLLTAGVAVLSGSENVDVVANHLVGAGDRAIQLGGGGTLEGYRPPPSMDSTANVEGKNLRAIANLVEGSQAPVALVGCVQCTFLNNTVIDPKQTQDGLAWLVRILAEPPPGYTFLPPQQASIVNNIFYFQASELTATLNIADEIAGVESGYTISNNLWFSHDDPARSAPDLAAASETASIIGEDPLFSTGFAIGGESPAAGAGAARNELHGDRAGRCYRDPPSLGAFETF